MIQLNPQSPNPQATKLLQEMGLKMGEKYSVHWNYDFAGEWELKNNGKVILSMKCTKVDLLLKAKILVRSPWSCKS